MFCQNIPIKATIPAKNINKPLNTSKNIIIPNFVAIDFNFSADNNLLSIVLILPKI